MELNKDRRSSKFASNLQTQLHKLYVLLESSRTFQNLLEHSRTFQNLLEPSKTLQKPLEPFRTFQNLLEANRTFKNLLKPSRTFQNLLGPSRTFQNLLEPSRTLQNLLEPSNLYICQKSSVCDNPVICQKFALKGKFKNPFNNFGLRLFGLILRYAAAFGKAWMWGK